MISSLFKSNSVSTPPIEVNVNLKFDEVQHSVSVNKKEDEPAKISETARPIIRRIGIILALGVLFALTAPWLMPPEFVQEIVRILFVCVIGLILDHESSKKSKITYGPYSFELK